MDFFEAVRKRRSIRRLTTEPVAEDDLRAILEAACMAPSGENEQPWRFLVVRERERLQEMRAMVEAIIQLRLEEAAGDEERVAGIKYLEPFSTHFGDAPCVIFVTARPFVGARGEVPGLNYDPGLQSVAAATAFLVLAATALGYGSCWTTAPVDFAREELQALLGIGEPWYLVAVVPLGRPVRYPDLRPHKAFEEVVNFLD